MARGVGVAEGVAQDIGVAIEGLGRRRVGDQGVGTDEFAQGRVVVAGLIVVQPQAGVPALAGVLVAGGGMSYFRCMLFFNDLSDKGVHFCPGDFKQCFPILLVRFTSEDELENYNVLSITCINTAAYACIRIVTNNTYLIGKFAFIFPPSRNIINLSRQSTF